MSDKVARDHLVVIVPEVLYRCRDCGHEDLEAMRVEYSSPVTGSDYDLQCLVCRSTNVEAT